MGDKRLYLALGGFGVVAAALLLSRHDEPPKPSPKPDPGPSPNPSPEPRLPPVETPLPMLHQPSWSFLNPDQRVWAIGAYCVGCSLSNRFDDLAKLVGRGVDGLPYANEVARWQTNCATSALGMLATACETPELAARANPYLAKRSIIGQSMSWLVYGIGGKGNPSAPYRRFEGFESLPSICIGHYWSGGNNDHVEIIGKPRDPGKPQVRMHLGGGRPNNAITMGEGDVSTSAGRPLQGYIDLSRIAIPPAAPVSDTGYSEWRAEEDRLESVVQRSVRMFGFVPRQEVTWDDIEAALAKGHDDLHLASLQGGEFDFG